MRAERRVNFLRFVRMVVEGRSDVTYRAYDLMHDGKIVSLKRTLSAAGYPWNYNYEMDVQVYQVQADIRNAGLGLIPLKDIHKLLHEYSRYRRILLGYGRKTPRRSRVESHAMYAQNKAKTGG